MGDQRERVKIPMITLGFRCRSGPDAETECTFVLNHIEFLARRHAATPVLLLKHQKWEVGEIDTTMKMQATCKRVDQEIIYYRHNSI